LDKFQPEAIDQTELVRRLLEAGQSGQITLAEKLNKLLRSQTLNQAQLARDMMDGGGELTLARNLHKFQPQAVNRTQLAHRMMHNDWKCVLAQNLEKFPTQAIDHVKLAQDLMANGWKGVLAQNLYKFQELPDDVRERLPAKVVRTPTTTDPAGRYHPSDGPIENE
jgi:hypothetical protein